MAKLIAVYTGIGVTTAVGVLNKKGIKAVEVTYDQSKNNINPQKLFIEEVTHALENNDMVFINPIVDVITYFLDKGQRITIITPEPKAKDSYVERLQTRNKSEEEIEYARANFEIDTQALIDYKHPRPFLKTIVLTETQALDKTIEGVLHHLE